MNGELFTDVIRKLKLEVVNVQFLKYVLVVANPVYNGCSTGKRDDWNRLILKKKRILYFSQGYCLGS